MISKADYINLVFYGTTSDATTYSGDTGSLTYDTYTTAGTTSTTGLDYNDLEARIYKQYVSQLSIRPGNNYALPDGSSLKIDAAGNYTIEDKNAQVTYKACRIRDFNRFLNASDLLEEFIRDIGKLGARQNQVLNIPITVFIHWLIFKAAEQDGDPIPKNVPRIETHIKKQPRCKYCQRFLSFRFEDLGLHFCNPNHYDLFMRKQGVT